MAEEIVIEGGIELQKTLNDGAPVKLDQIEGWSELGETEKLYLSNYFDTYPNQSLASFRAGIPYSRLKKWKNNKVFMDVFSFIETLHNDTLAAIHFNEAHTNSKIRTGVLKAVKAKGYEPEKKTQHNSLVFKTDGASMPAILKELKNSD